MKSNDQRVFNGTAGPPYLQHQSGARLVIEHKPPSHSFSTLESNIPLQILQHTSNTFNYNHHHFNKGLYRINSALDLDHQNQLNPKNLKREFGSVSSIDVLGLKQVNYLLDNKRSLNSKMSTHSNNYHNNLIKATPNNMVKTTNPVNTNNNSLCKNSELTDSGALCPSNASSFNNTNMPLDENVGMSAPSPRLVKKIHKFWDNGKHDKNNLKNKSNKTNENNEFAGTTKGILRKFTRMGSSKNTNMISENCNLNAQTSEEFKNLCGSTNRLDDPEIRFEEKLRKKAFAHYDVQSITANLLYASKICHSLSKRRNTTTGASAASMMGMPSKTPNGLSTIELKNAENPEMDLGDDRSNELVLSCPFFRNELGGEQERMISLNRVTTNSSKNQSTVIHRPYNTSGLCLLEDANERRWKTRCCPYQRIANPEYRSLLIENSDIGSNYYRHHFYGLEHQNWFGIDENLGPIAISIRRERIPVENIKNKVCSLPNIAEVENGVANTNALIQVSSNSQSTKNQYRLIIRTSELSVLRGTVFEDCVPALSNNRGSNHHNNHHAKEVLEYVAPEITLSSLKLGVSNADEQLLRLDEQALTRRYKVGVLYCKAGQSTEEEMYNNENAGPAFEEFLTCLGEKICLKGFEAYRAGLDNKSDTTGLHSIYSTFADCEIMFHVSTLLPYTANNKQQLLRKRHIGNDIVTIVFQEADARQFTPKSIRSQFQHVFIVVRILPNNNNGVPKYAVAISRSKEVPVFGPPIPDNGIFTKSKAFTEFLLSKIINAENAAHRSEKFKSMAQRTRNEYLKDLSQNYTINTTINDVSSVGSSASAKIASIFSGAGKKSRSNRACRDSHFIGDSVIKGAICWEMCVEDFGQSKVIDCLVAISSDSLVIIEESTKEMVFVCPNISILGWTSHPNCIKIFYHQGECVLLKCKDTELDEIGEIVTRLKNVSNGCETQEMILKRNNAGQLGFHVGFDGIVTQVEHYAYAWQAGLKRYARIVEICKVAIATLSYEQMQDLLKTSLTVSVTILPPINENTPRRGCNLSNCSYVVASNLINSSNCTALNYSVRSDYENVNNVFDRVMRNQARNRFQINTLSSNVGNNNLNNSNQNGVLSSTGACLTNNRNVCSSPSSNSSITSKSLPVSPDQACKLSINSLSSSSSAYSTLVNNSRLYTSPSPYQQQHNVAINASNNSGKSDLVSKTLSMNNCPNHGYSNLKQNSNVVALSRSKTMLDSSSSLNNNSWNNTLNCATSAYQNKVLSTGQPMFPINHAHKQMNATGSSGMNASTVSSIAGSIHHSLHELSVVAGSTVQGNRNLSVVNNCNKPTSDYNSDTSSSNEWNSNTWSLPVCTSNSLVTNQPSSNQGVIYKQKLSSAENKQMRVNSNVLSSGLTSSGTIALSSSGANQVNAIRSGKRKQSNTSSSTLQEDLLRLINVDCDNCSDNASEINSSCSTSSQICSNEDSSATSYSSLERVNNNASRNLTEEISRPINTNTVQEDLILTCMAQPAQVISSLSCSPVHNNSIVTSTGISSLSETSTTNSASASTGAGIATSHSSACNSSFPLVSGNSGGEIDWPSLVSTATKAMAMTNAASQQATGYNTSEKNVSKEHGSESNVKVDQQPSSSTSALSSVSQHRNSLDQWIREFEHFSKNACVLNSNEQLSEIGAENVKSLEDRLKRLQNDLVKEQCDKITLEEQVKHLQQENQRLHEESQTAAAQLRKFTEWFFQNINAK